MSTIKIEQNSDQSRPNTPPIMTMTTTETNSIPKEEPILLSSCAEPVTATEPVNAEENVENLTVPTTGDDSATSSSVVPILTLPPAALIPNKIRNLRKRSGSRISVSSDTSEKIPCKTLKKQHSEPPPIPLKNLLASDPNKKPTPLDELIKAASILNPRQFELPREMNIYCQFPGGEKVEPSACNKNGAKRPPANKPKNKLHELDQQGLVSLPAKTCFTCRRSCKKAPLIACDYCTLYFHQDCLDPPLTALPTGMWMCPNHPEQFIDGQLVTSISATERIKLWNHFNGPIDHDTIKAEFMRKVHFKNPPFRVKLKPKDRNCVEIPPMIQHHYKNPPSMIPSLKEVLRYEAVTSNAAHNLINDGDLKIENPNLLLDEDVQRDLDELKRGERLVSGEQSPQRNDDDVEMVGGRDEPVVVNDVVPITTQDIKFEVDVEEELRNLDMSLVKMLALQRLQQIIDENPAIVERNDEKRTKIGEECKKVEIVRPLPSQLLTKADIERIAKQFCSPDKGADGGGDGVSNEDDGDKLMYPGYFEAEDKYKPGMDENLPMRVAQMNGGEESRFQNFVHWLERPIAASKIRCRAIVTPVTNNFESACSAANASLEHSVYMRYRKLTIGSGPGSDVCLTTYGQCALVSPKHAVIFYDEVSYPRFF